MGYACPICDAPQADGEHLANHLAFTAMLHDDEHADFLDTRIDDWREQTPPALAAKLIPHADEVAYDTVFEDTTEAGGLGRESVDEVPTGEASSSTADDAPIDFEGLADETVDEETQRVIEEARRLFTSEEPSTDEE